MLLNQILFHVPCPIFWKDIDDLIDQIKQDNIEVQNIISQI